MSHSRLPAVLSSLGLLVAAILWVAALWTTQLAVGAYGIVPSLSPLWYVAALLAFCGLIVSAWQHRYANAAGYAILIAFFVALPPLLLEKSVRFPYVFNSYRYADQLLQTGIIDYRDTYLAWPGWHIVSAATVGAGQWDAAGYLLWTSLLLGVVTMAATAMLFIRLTGGGRLFWTSLIAGLALVGGLAYPVPGAMAALLWTVLLVLVIDEHLSHQPRSLGRRLVSLALIGGIVVTHLLTSLAAGASLLFIMLGGRLAGRRLRLGTITIAAGSFVLAFLFYVATETTIQLLPAQLRTMLDFERYFSSTLAETGRAIGGGSSEHLAVVLVRIGYVVAASALAVVALVVGIARRHGREPSVWLPAAVAGSGATTLVIGPYGGEIIIRGYSFASLGMGPLIGRLVAGRLGMLLLPVLAVGILLAPIRLYGNEMYDYVRPQELAADHWVDVHGPPTYTLKGVSRTLLARWQAPDAAAPTVTVSGPVYRKMNVFLRGDFVAPTLRAWQYDNGDVQVAMGETP